MATSPAGRADKHEDGRLPEVSSRIQRAACGACVVNALVTATHAFETAPFHTPQMPPGPAGFLTAVALSTLALWIKMHGAADNV